MNFKKCMLLLGIVTTIPLFADFSLDLRVSLVREYGADGGFPFTPSISENGSQAYVVYPINATIDDQIIAELFDNDGGTLTSIDTILYDGGDLFSIIDNGFASPDFTRFTLVADNDLDSIRIRLYDETLTQIDEEIFPDYDPGNDSFSGNGGQWSADGNFILMTYLTDATPGSLTTIIRVLDAATLESIDDTTIGGGSFGGIFIQFHGRTYVAVTSYDTTTGNDWVYAFDRDNAAPPSTLFVYEFEDDTLTLVDSVLLPQGADGPSAVVVDKHLVYIGVGTSRAVNDGEITIFSDNTDKTTFPDTNGREARIYTFDGSDLSLAVSRNFNAGVQAPTFTPDAEHVIFAIQAIDAAPGFLRGYEIKGHHDLKLKAETAPIISAPFYNAAISENGKWLLVTGSDQSSGDTNQPNVNSQVNNINLYKISD